MHVGKDVFYVGAGDHGITFDTPVMRLRSPSLSYLNASSFGQEIERLAQEW